MAGKTDQKGKNQFETIDGQKEIHVRQNTQKMFIFWREHV